MDYSMVEAERHGALVTADDQKSGAALWWRPLAPEIETQRSKNKREFIRQYVGSSCIESDDAMVAFMAEKSARQIDPQAWYLSIINIHPNAQGRGLGVHLVERILQQTDRLKRATYLETFSPPNISFYERFGYQTLDRVYEPTSKTDYWLMVRGWRAGSDCFSEPCYLQLNQAKTGVFHQVVVTLGRLLAARLPAKIQQVRTILRAPTAGPAAVRPRPGNEGIQGPR